MQEQRAAEMEGGTHNPSPAAPRSPPRSVRRIVASRMSGPYHVRRPTFRPVRFDGSSVEAQNSAVATMATTMDGQHRPPPPPPPARSSFISSTPTTAMATMSIGPTTSDAVESIGIGAIGTAAVNGNVGTTTTAPPPSDSCPGSSAPSATTYDIESVSASAVGIASGGRYGPTEEDRSQSQSSSSSLLTALPTDVLLSVLGYMTARELDGSVGLVSRAMRLACDASPLWRDLCLRTGKIVENGAAIDASPALREQSAGLAFRSASDGDAGTGGISFRNLYRKVRCVPVDCPSIAAAFGTLLGAAVNGEAAATVTLMPGVYEERIVVDTAFMSDDLGADVALRVEVRAAFPHLGATVVHDVPPGGDILVIGPTISINSFDESVISVALRDLTILHSVPGLDIWSTNSAVVVNSNSTNSTAATTTLTLHNCTVSSASGRGVVVTNGARADLSGCTLVDCAATGLYVGDDGSAAFLSGCNVVGNGFGSKRGRSGWVHGGGTGTGGVGGRYGGVGVGFGRTVRRLRYDDDGRPDDDEAEDDDADGDGQRRAEGYYEREDENTLVPPGHSGVYVEAADTTVVDTLIARNSLTGLSVVRAGRVRLSGCDVTMNGAEPVSVEDALNLAATAQQQRGQLQRGGVTYGPIPTNTVGRYGHPYGATVRHGAGSGSVLLDGL